MIQIKKTILTLVALLAISTGAWAEGYYDINIHFDPGYRPEFTNFMCDVMGPDMPSGTLNLSVDGVSKGSFRVDNGMCSSQIHSLDAGDHTWSAEFTPDGSSEKSTESRSFTIDQNYAWVYIDDPEQSSIEMGVGESRYFRGHVDGPESSEVNISSSNDNVAKFRASSSFSYEFEGYIDAVGAGTATITVSFAGNKNYKAAQSKTLTVTVLAPAASGPEVAWNKAEKTGQFTMPGGNVTLEPEYYPQAALTAVPTAINDVPATTDGAIVKAGTVANIGSTATAQGTVMYYVSQTALDDAALLALAADQWTADVPTAEKLAQGEAYVYYYVRGNDSDTDEENFSDGDILAANALTVTIAAEPTYAVTFAEGTDPKEWTADPNAGVKKGTPVTVTYTGPRKVMGVKAEKKKVAEGHALSASAVGEIVGTDGKAYAAADKDILPDGVTAVAMVAYKSETTGSSLAIALADESNSDWNTAKSTCEGKSAVTNAAWLLPSQNQWKTMFSANGGNEGQYTDLNTAITTAGGTALQGTPPYWSSTPSGYDDGTAYNVLLGGGGAEWYRDYYEETRYRVRAVLAF